ncbi:MAG: hypothetical protein KY444_09310, partial [Gemmatimonadetes bacterium]|nr:hypothetical protein [Gemmatimonadota bacterium]
MTEMLSELLRQPLFQALGWSLVHFLWQGTLLVVVVRALLLMLGRASASARYSLACAGLLAMAVIPIATGVAMYPRVEAVAPSAQAAQRAGGEAPAIEIGAAPVRQELPATATKPGPGLREG